MTASFRNLKEILRQSQQLDDEAKQHLFPHDKFRRNKQFLINLDENGKENGQGIEYRYRSNSRDRSGSVGNSPDFKPGLGGYNSPGGSSSSQRKIALVVKTTRKAAKSVDCLKSSEHVSTESIKLMDNRIKKIDEILRKSKEKMGEMNRDLNERKVFRQITENLSKINVCYLNTQNHHRSMTPLSPRKTVSRKTSFIAGETQGSSSSRSEISNITPRTYQPDQESFLIPTEEMEKREIKKESPQTMEFCVGRDMNFCKKELKSLKNIKNEEKETDEQLFLLGGTLRGRRQSVDKNKMEKGKIEGEVIVEMKVSLHPKMKDRLKKVKNKKESLKQLTPFKCALNSQQEDIKYGECPRIEF
jgi:hypothetical protein